MCKENQSRTQSGGRRDKEHQKQRPDTGGISLITFTSHNSPFQPLHCHSAPSFLTSQHPKAHAQGPGGEQGQRRRSCTNHGESRSGGHLPPGPRHGRRRRRARSPRGEGSEPGKFPFLSSSFFLCSVPGNVGIQAARRSPGVVRLAIADCRAGTCGSCSSSAGSRCGGPTSSA